MDDNVINELAGILDGKINSKIYADQLMGLLRDSIKRNYIERFQGMMRDYKDSARNNECREVKLINAMKPFFNSGQSKDIDKISSMISDVFALKTLMNDLLTARQGDVRASESMKPDMPLLFLVLFLYGMNEK